MFFLDLVVVKFIKSKKTQIWQTRLSVVLFICLSPRNACSRSSCPSANVSELGFLL